MRDEPQRPTNDDRSGLQAHWSAHGIPWSTEPGNDVEPEIDVPQAPTAPMRPSGIVYFVRHRKQSRADGITPDSSAFRTRYDAWRTMRGSRRSLSRSVERPPHALSTPIHHPASAVRPPRSRQGPQRPSRPRVRSVMAAVVLVLILIGALGLAISRWGGWGTARVLPVATSALQRPTAGQPTAAASPFGRPSPTGGPSSTPTSTPNSQPKLVVSPKQITITLCVAGSAQFTVSNGGGGELTWIASASNLVYVVSPSRGSLASGAQETVVVTGITLSVGLSGQITVTAAGAEQSPQTVVITCHLL